MFRRVLLGGRGALVGAAVLGVYGATVLRPEADSGGGGGDDAVPDASRFPALPGRDAQLAALRRGRFDLLVIGGGATGTGCALDAASRGLRTALVEEDDFASGTSSRSTKLVHGGVRYLEKAFKELDYGQYRLVREALHERKTFLHIAPHLSDALPIMLPVYKWWQLPYFWVGTKVYDLLAGGENMESSYLLSRGKALEAFPMLKSERLVGALVYYDGQHNDARMNVSLALSAVLHGAVVANHVKVTKLLKNTTGRVVGASVRDTITGETWDVHAKGVINATGPFCDSIRLLDDPETKKIVAPSSGVHIILPGYYAPQKMGLLDPNTSDGRVIFFLPWQGNTIAGTTDAPTVVTHEPLPTEEEVCWILSEIRNYLNPDIHVRRSDVLAAWSGIRPLVMDPKAKNTESLVRNHLIDISLSGLITVSGGKWTTYRQMAEETIDQAIQEFGLTSNGPCRTREIRLIGSDGFRPTLFIRLIQQFGIDADVSKHLLHSYGDRAWSVASMSERTGQRWPITGCRLAGQYPYIEAEVRYAVRCEYAITPVDVLARRTRLAFLNAQAALEALPRVIDIMAEELHWSRRTQQQEWERTVKFLMTMGLPAQMGSLSRKDVERGLRPIGDDLSELRLISAREASLAGQSPFSA